MNASKKCLQCLYEKQSQKANGKEKNKELFLQGLKEILFGKDNNTSTAVLLYRINRLHEKCFGYVDKMTELKSKYNHFIMEQEPLINEILESSTDRLDKAISFACVGNYIDFGANAHITEEELKGLIVNVKNKSCNQNELKIFKEELKNAKTLVYLADNCGEIVFDKILVKTILELYPNLDITFMVRGGEVLNDVTMVDANEVGITKLVKVVDNGVAVAGTPLDMISKEAKEIITGADVIISKGQGNFESLLGENLNPYYLFMCKCEMFVERLKLSRLDCVFCKESRLNLE
ncbi:MAG: DUF89 family protein [Clostridia bacterium]|nr:DUF89 family protein [Clostridia bacterium]